MKSISVRMFVELLNAAIEATTSNGGGERKLFEDLFSDYVPEVRPRIDPTKTVDIMVNLDLNHIKHLVWNEPQLLPSFVICLFCEIRIKISYIVALID